MLKRFFALSITGAIVLSSAPQGAHAAFKPADHLVPVDANSEASGLGAAYRRLYERKLLVTPGDVARFIFLPVFNGKERTSSVYRDVRKRNALPGGFWVTATQPSMYLWDCVNPGGEKIDSRTVLVHRRDAPLPESTARAINEVWLAMLTATRPRPANEVPGESDRMIFLAINANGALFRAQANSFHGKNRALIELGDGLVQYCEVSPAHRAEVARKIEEAALALLKRFKKN